MRPLIVLLVATLLTGCGPLDRTEITDAGPESCPDETSAWTVDLAADTPGAPTAAAAIAAREGDAALPLPAGEPDARPVDDDRVRFVFTDAGRYTGQAMVIRLEGGWVVESAERCS